MDKGKGEIHPVVALGPAVGCFLQPGLTLQFILSENTPGYFLEWSNHPENLFIETQH